MEKYSAEQAAEIINAARENIRRPVEISTDRLPPEPEDRLARWRRQEAAERKASEASKLTALRDEYERLRSLVRDMRAEINDVRGLVFDVVRGANEAIEKIAEVGEDRERAIAALTAELHQARIDLANLRGDHAELKLIMASKTGDVLLPNPLARRPQIN